MKFLKGVVIVMGIAIAVGIGILGYVIYKRSGALIAQEEEPAPPLAEQGALPAFPPASLGLPAGSRVQKMVVSGGRLVVSVVVPEQGERIVIIDLRSGAELGSIGLEEVP